MKKNILLMLVAAAVWSGCSKNEIERPVIDDANEIKVSSSLVDVSASTRATYDALIPSDAAPLTALVLATTTTNNYSSLHAAGEMTFVGNNTTNPGGTAYNKSPQVKGSHFFPAGTADFYLSGLYPATGWSTIDDSNPDTPAITDGKLTFTLSGKEDVLYAMQQTTSKANIVGGNYAVLEFKHQLTLLKLSIYGDEDATTSNRTKIKSITLTKANGNNDVLTQVTADLNAGTVTPLATGTSGTLPFYKITADKTTDDEYTFTTGNEYVVTQTSADQAYVLAPPVTASDAAGTYEYTLQIAYLDNSVVRPATVGIDLKNESNPFTGFTAGRKFNITLEFKGGQIRANATVGDWIHIDGTTGEVEV
jgi:hypothetical protein